MMDVNNKVIGKKYSQKDDEQTEGINKDEDKQQPKQKIKDPQLQQQIVFGSQPISMKCPFCLNRVRTEVVLKPELISIMLGLALFSLIPNAIMIVAIVVILQFTATRKHRCSLCERQLGSDGKFLIVFTDRVYSFTLGQNGVLISKKILVTIGLFLLTFFIIYLRSTMQTQYQWIDLTWKDLLQKCPASNQSPKCNSDNYDKAVKNWRGYVMRVQDRRDSMRKYYDYALEIYVKMEPSENSAKSPDIYLTGTSSKIYEFYQILDQLSHGDEILFNGTFAPARGLPGQIINRHLYLINLNRTGLRNQSIQVYMTNQQQQYFQKKVEGKTLRKQAS